jgi:hypothetical protein
MTLSVEEFSRCERGLRGPAWRSRTAQELTDVHRLSVAQLWDPLTIEAAKYFALRADGADGLERAAAAYPKIDAAITLHADSAKTDIMKLLTLADVCIDSIAERVGTKSEVVATWEQLFFDVRGMRSATGWLSIHVIRHECRAGNTALAARMKLALVAGVEGVNAVLAMDHGAPLDEAERLFQRKLKLGLKFDEAAEMPIDSPRSRVNFVKLYVYLQQTEQQLEFAEKKLAARCAEARDRHELAKMRLEFAHERAMAKANEKQQKAERRRQAQEAQNAEAASARELQRYVRLAREKAAACRAAESPLARLTWGTSKPKPVATPVPFSLSAAEKLAERLPKTTDADHEFDTDAYPYDGGSPTGARELEIVSPFGGA